MRLNRILDSILLRREKMAKMHYFNLGEFHPAKLSVR